MTMLINMDYFFSGTLSTVDSVIGNFVNDAYVRFIQANSNVITLSFTVYVMFLGYQFLSHSNQFNLNTVSQRLVVMLCVYAMILNWRLYHLFVYNIFTTEPGNIAQILVNSTGKFQSTESVSDALDTIFSTVINAAMEFFGQVSFSASGMSFLFYGMLVLIIGGVLCVFALLLFIYAKMMMAVSLALGPIFILFILWDSTKGMFSAWLNKLVTIALIPVVTSAILVLMLSVINVTLSGVNLPSESLEFKGIAPFLGLSLTTTLILSQVFKICSALGGGITLSSLTHGVAIAKSSLQSSGATAMGRFASDWAKNKAQQMIKRRGIKGGE